MNFGYVGRIVEKFRVLAAAALIERLPKIKQLIGGATFVSIWFTLPEYANAYEVEGVYGVCIEYARDTVKADLVESRVTSRLDNLHDPYLGRKLHLGQKHFTDQWMYRGITDLVPEQRTMGNGGFKTRRECIERVLTPPVNPIK